MFDIHEYIGKQIDTSEIRVTHDETGMIDEDISFNITNLLKNRFDSQYRRDKFKYGSKGIDIIYPRISYPGRRILIKGSDQVRFLLSLYPQKSDFDNIDKIVLRPRHIEIGDIELMSLYIRNKKILVIYLFTPHFYSIKDSKFREYAEFIPCQLSELVNSVIIKKNNKNSKISALKIPPLWYLLSIISHSHDNMIDKFFIKKDKENSREISMMLDEISFFYSRYGY